MIHLDIPQAIVDKYFIPKEMNHLLKFDIYEENELVDCWFVSDTTELDAHRCLRLEDFNELTNDKYKTKSQYDMERAVKKAVNNAKWDSSISGRMASDDVCIETEHNKFDDSVELHLTFDSQEQAIIKLNEEQKQQLIKKLLS